MNSEQHHTTVYRPCVHRLQTGPVQTPVYTGYRQSLYRPLCTQLQTSLVQTRVYTVADQPCADLCVHSYSPALCVHSYSPALCVHSYSPTLCVHSYSPALCRPVCTQLQTSLEQTHVYTVTDQPCADLCVHSYSPAHRCRCVGHGHCEQLTLCA